jgi:enoyl-CoA hydratase
MSREYQTLRYEVDGHIAKMTFTRPEILNRMDDVTSEEVVHVIEGLRRPGGCARADHGLDWHGVFGGRRFG